MTIILPKQLIQQYLRMKVELLLKASLLLLLTQTTLSSYCPGTFSGHYTSCRFSYAYRDINCTDFQFVNCTWDECVYYYTVGNDTYCGQYLSRCCGSSNYEYSYHSFEQCEDDMKSKYLKSLIIIFSIIGGIIGAFVLVGLCCCFGPMVLSFCGCLCQGLGKLGNCLVYLITCNCLCPRSQNRVGQAELNQSAQSLSSIKKWQKVQNKPYLQSQICGICLEPGSTIQLECGYANHRICIISWIKKKEECTICRANRLRKAKVYCQKCLGQYFEANLLIQKSYFQLQMQICNNCQ